MDSLDAGHGAARRRIAGWVCLLLLLGLGTTAAGAWAARHAEHRAAVAGAGRRAELTSAAVRAEIRRYEDAVTTVAAALSAQEDVDRQAFEKITAPLAGAQLSGAAGITFVVRAHDVQMLATQAHWRQRGVDRLTLQPWTPGTPHLFTIFDRSLDGVPETLGADLSYSDAVNQTLTIARRNGPAAVSGRHVLLKDQQVPVEHRQDSFILAAVVDEPVTGMTRGWVLISVRAGDLLRHTLESASQRGVNATLSVPAADGRQVEVARKVSGAASDPELVRRQQIRAAQDEWSLEVQSTDVAVGLDTGGGHLGMAVLLGGGAISVLLAGVLYLLLSSRLRAFVAVEEATAELRLAEGDARRQAGLLSAVLDSISDGVSVVDERGKFLVHNPAARTIFGLEESFGDSQDWQDRFSVLRPDGVTPFATDELPLSRAVRGEVTDNVEMIVRHAGKPGGTPISASGRPLDPRAGVTGAVAGFHDMSARVEAAREIRAAEERFRFAFDHAHVGMAMSDLSGESGGNGRLLRVNESFCGMLGYTVGELLNRSFLDLTYPEDRAGYAATVTDLVDGGGDTMALEQRFLHADGHTIWASVNSTIIRGTQGEAQYAITQIEDITQRRAEAERLAAMVLQDTLTGLGNRMLLVDRMEQAAVRSARSGHLLAVLFCDLDGFKAVNDVHGHASGDDVLREVARRIRDTVRPADTVVRLGGDEFVVLCEEIVRRADVDEIAGRIQAVLSAPVQLTSGAYVRIGCSVGMAVADGPDIGVEGLLQHADAEMYAAKRAARLRPTHGSSSHAS